MAAEPTSIHQFRALRFLDRFFGTDDVDERNRRYDAALSRLDDGSFSLTSQTVAGIESAASDDGAPDPMRHLEEHWLSGTYWPSIGGDTVSATIQSGFRDAIKDARDAGLPLHAVWVCATDDHKADVFRVDHVTGPTAVIVAIITPRPNPEAYGR